MPRSPAVTPGCGEIQGFRIAFPAAGDENRIDAQLITRLKSECYFSRLLLTIGAGPGTPMKTNSVLLHGCCQSAGKFSIQKRKEGIAPVNQMNAGAQGGEGGRVLAANHARTHHCHRFRETIELEDRIGVVDLAASERETRRVSRGRSCRDQNVVALE